MTTELQSTDMMVMTVPVPATRPDELSISALGRDVTVLGPDGFSHKVAMPLEADMECLHAELFHGILALRAPRVPTALAAPPAEPREIPVQPAV